MSGHGARRASTSIGSLTRRDHYREAALRRKIDNEYRSMASTGSARRRRKQLRSARRHERALNAHQRRPHSALVALAMTLTGALVVIVATGVSTTLALIVAFVLFVDLRVLRRRKRLLRRP